MSAKNDKTLREMLDEFEAIVAWFNGEDLDVEAASAKFEEGSKLAEQIRKKLAEEKNKIEIIEKSFAGKNEEEI
ncbi:exodeoxyribonuclease VII small subunit [Candidatus Saccharibacteria bacterium]|nr:exodeoxyribonuclease VII small subunit [Candidatus Saccharibacteria bacterium]